MNKIITALASLIIVHSLSAQHTILTLPTATNASSFGITQSDTDTLLKVFGDGGFYLGGTNSSGAIPKEGAGTRLMWYPKKSALRAGTVSSTFWNDNNIGMHSVGFGYNTMASGDGSTAMGQVAMASGDGSTAIGINHTASGNFSTAMGYFTSASGNASTAMGYHTTASGISSTALGEFTVASGSYSTAMGLWCTTNSKTGAFVIGDASSGNTNVNSSANNEMTMRFDGGYRLFTNFSLTTGVTMASGANSWSSVSDSTKKTNFLKPDGEYFLSSLSKLKLGSWNYKSQDERTFRHYGPMAQEIFHYFGNDGVGTIGNDTTLATADMDGIMMICLQALEKRTQELTKANETISAMKSDIEILKTKLFSIINVIVEEKKNFSINNMERK